jgi:hypothetical protein
MEQMFDFIVMTDNLRVKSGAWAALSFSGSCPGMPRPVIRKEKRRGGQGETRFAFGFPFHLPLTHRRKLV